MGWARKYGLGLCPHCGKWVTLHKDRTLVSHGGDRVEGGQGNGMIATCMRQFAVTEIWSGDVTLVMAPVYVDSRKQENWVGTQIAARAGLRYPVDCLVTVVPKGQERPLPFGDCPLVLRRRVRV